MGGYANQFCDSSKHQLEAYVVDSDQSVIEKCIICGWKYFHIITPGNDDIVKQSFSGEE
jgi:hypothetical protein